ncbi:MAG: hypothetical protein QM489_00590 [Candidatus Izemoplasma sp.]
MINKNSIIDAYCLIRKIDHTIPDEVLNFMKESALSKLQEFSNEPLIHICFIKAYEYKGWKFEYDRGKPYGPWPLKKDLEPRERAGQVFYNLFSEFYKLEDAEQEKYRIEI